MDIWFLSVESSIHIRPASIHGMLWLQTHFENDNWEALASGKVKLAREDAESLAIDAKKAGLILNSVPSISKTETSSRIY